MKDSLDEDFSFDRIRLITEKRNSQSNEAYYRFRKTRVAGIGGKYKRITPDRLDMYVFKQLCSHYIHTSFTM